MENERRLDPVTEKFFRNKPKWYRTTLAQCEKCGQYYKPDLGHKCHMEHITQKGDKNYA